MRFKIGKSAWGSDKTYAHMSVGWAWAFDTPFNEIDTDRDDGERHQEGDCRQAFSDFGF